MPERVSTTSFVVWSIGNSKSNQLDAQGTFNPSGSGGLRLYKILFHFKALLWESTILLVPPSTCKAYPIAILLHEHCATYAPPHCPPPFYAIHHTILVIAISCKGQGWSQLASSSPSGLFSSEPTRGWDSWAGEHTSTNPNPNPNPGVNPNCEARLSHLPFWGPSEGFFLIN